MSSAWVLARVQEFIIIIMSVGNGVGLEDHIWRGIGTGNELHNLRMSDSGSAHFSGFLLFSKFRSW